MQRVSSENTILSKENKLNEKAILNVKTSIKELQNSSEKNIEENRKTMSLLEHIISKNEDFLRKNESEGKEEQELINTIQHLTNLVTEESKARELFYQDLENKYSNLESEVKLLKKQF